MKRSIFFALTLICSLPLFFAFTNAPIIKDGLIVETQESEEKKSFVLKLANLQKKPLRIHIYDQEGHKLYSEKVLNHNGYRKLYHMNQLDAGVYEIVLYHPLESKKGRIEVTPKTATVVWD